MATLAEVRTRALQRADMEYNSAVAGGNRYVTTTELNQLINVSYKRLYGTLVRYGMHRAETTYAITGDGRFSTYDLPADMYAILGVYRVEDSGDSVYLGRHDHRHRPNTQRTNDASTYRVVGADIQFSPYPADGTYHVVYVPGPADLSADSDTIDSVLGWEEYVVIDVAIKLKLKEGTDVSGLLADRELLIRQIQDEARDEEMSETYTIADVRGGSERLLPGGDPLYLPMWWF
jgi:hypothetical protein